MLDYYQVLGVSASASPADIRAAYRALAFQHHPDVSGADGAVGRARFQQIQEAYDVLRHPKRRSEYDSLRSFSQGASRRAGDSGGFGEWNDLGCARAAAEDRERGFEEAFHEWFKRSGCGWFWCVMGGRRGRRRASMELRDRTAFVLCGYGNGVGTAWSMRTGTASHVAGASTCAGGATPRCVPSHGVPSPG